MKPVHQTTDEEFAHQVHHAVRALPDAPAAWQQAAIGLWPAQAPPSALSAAQAAQALVRWVAAVLTFDSWAPAGAGWGLAPGMRSVRGATRHLLYSARGRDIDLRITAAAESFVLSGQILGPDETGRVELAPAAEKDESAVNPAIHPPTHRSPLDDLGEFRLEDVPAGRYVLTLHLGAEPIVVQPIEVGEAAA